MTCGNIQAVALHHLQMQPALHTLRHLADPQQQAREADNRHWQEIEQDAGFSCSFGVMSSKDDLQCAVRETSQRAKSASSLHRGSVLVHVW